MLLNYFQYFNILETKHSFQCIMEVDLGYLEFFVHTLYLFMLNLKIQFLQYDWKYIPIHSVDLCTPV